MLVLLIAVVTGAVALTNNKFSVKDGTEDATKWTVKPTEATTTGMAAGTQVKAKYSGKKKVKSIKAVKKAAAGPEGAINGKFTINDSGDQVYFSQGNLQAMYNGSAWLWAFAENQWDYIGGRSNSGSETQTGNNFINGNGTVSANCTVDLFGWVGASSTWTDATMYGISNSTITNRTDTYGNIVSENLKSDWGNTIGSGWRTLTKDEWNYLFITRTTGGTVGSTSQASFAHATINIDGTSVNGMILFPDGVNFASTEFTTLDKVNHSSNWGTKCTSAQWTALEGKGCVFLPAAGKRIGSTVINAGSDGCYWSSSPHTSIAKKASYVIFEYNFLSLRLGNYRDKGFSVRLIRAAE